MRIRSIKPAVHLDEELWDLEQESGLPIFRAYTGLWGAADREGRFEWRPRMLKSEILPYWDGDFSRVLDALTARGFLVRYVYRGRHFGYVRTFKKHQVINNKETESALPSPDDSESKLYIPEDLTRGGRVDDASTTKPFPALEKNVRNMEGEQEGEQELCVRAEPRTLAQELNSAFVKAYTTLMSGPPNVRDTSAMVIATAPWIETAARLRGLTESELCQQLVKAFFASAKAAESRFKPSWLAHDPDEWLSPPRALSAVRGRSGPGPVATRAELEEAALSNPAWMNDPPANGVGK